MSQVEQPPAASVQTASTAVTQVSGAAEAQPPLTAVAVVPAAPSIERSFYDKAETFAWNLLLAIIIYVVGYWLAKLITGFVRRALLRQKADPTILSFICNIVYGFLIVVVLLTAADRIGLPTTSLVAIIGASTLAIGMALRDSLANFAAGVLLVVFRYYKVNDSVEVAGVFGTVEEIQIFSTVLTTKENSKIIVPNGNILKVPIRNLSSRPTHLLEIPVKVAYDTDVESTKALLLAIVQKEKDCLQTPEASVDLKGFGGGILEFTIRCWVDAGKRWKVLARLNEAIKAQLDEAQVVVK